jgi:UDP-glucose 4-epimerase
MKILVTGGAGFIASHITDRCIAEGHSVCVVDNLSSGFIENVNPSAKFYTLDIRESALEQIFEKEKFEIVIHHAAQMDVRHSVADPKYDADVNIIGGLNLYECCRKYNVRKVIFASTGGAIYGEQDTFPADEEHPQRPLSPYGISKLSNEKYLYYFKQVWGLESVILRYANVYGPRQNPHGEAGVVAIFCEKMLSGKQPIINGDGKQTRDYVYVGDVVEANILAIQYSSSNVFNIGTGRETDVNTIFRILRDNLSPTCAEQHGPAKAGEQLRSVISYSKTQTELGWNPIVSLEEGLVKTAEFFRQKYTHK